MPKDKDRSANPAAAQRKLEKQKELKKGKSEALVRRNEKLARRNPERIQRQINDLKQLEESGQKLRPREQQILEALGRDLRAVQKAREALGDKAPQFRNDYQSENRPGGGGGGRGRGDGVLGKRRRDGHGGSFGQDSDSSETDEEVRGIPMPRYTPPPVPRRHQKRDAGAHTETRGPHSLPNRPSAVESKTVYEAQPEIKDLRREAINKFVPAAVRVKQDAIKGQGKLLEPEEMDKLEKAGYQAGPAETEGPVDDNNEERKRRQLEEEERRFNQELRSVQIEEVEDEEA